MRSGQISLGPVVYKMEPDSSKTFAPTIAQAKTYVAADEQVLFAEIVWLSLSFALVVVYGIQRRFFPQAVVLRHLPWNREQVGKNSEGMSRCASIVSRIPLFAFIRQTLTLSEKQLIKQCGLDGYLTLRLIRFCMETLVAMSLLSIAVLTPVYNWQPRTTKCIIYCATHNSTTPVDAYRADCVCGFIDKCSMANVPAGDRALWTPAITMCIMTLWVMYKLKHEYKEVVRIRHAFWSSRPSRLHSVFVDRIPRALAPPSRLRDFYEKLFPGQIHSVELLSPIDALRHVGKRRMHVLMALERARVERDYEKKGKAPRHWAICPGSGASGWFSRVDTISELEKELDYLNDQFKLLRQSHDAHLEEIDKGENTRPRQAFVTFKNVAPTVIAAQTLVQANMVLKMAPNPNDVRWDSLGERNTAFWHFVRKTFSRVLFLFVVLFWGALTSFIGALTSAEALAQQFESLNKFLLENPNFTSWIDRLSTLVYVILIATVYPIIALSVKLEVRISQSNVERAILERYFLFLVVQVFVFYSIAGSVFKSVVDIATNPSHIFSTLSATIPKNASFFIGFISIKTFWLSFDLIRGNNFIFGLLRRILFGATKTKKEFNMQSCCCCWDFRFPSPMNLSGANANVLLVFFIATSYAVVQPLLTIVALIYFIAANLCFTTILTTSSKQMFDGGGIFWTHTYWCVVASIATAQMTLVGTLLTKQGFPQALFTFGLCVTTLVMSSHINDKYRAAATEVTLEIAAELDRFESTPKVEEVPCDRMFLYDVVFSKDHTGILNDDSDDEALEEEEPDVIKVYRYVHPVLLDSEIVNPDPNPAMDWSVQAGEDTVVTSSIINNDFHALRDNDEESDGLRGRLLDDNERNRTLNTLRGT